MTAQLLFYSQVVPLSSTNHRDLSIKAGQDFRFAARASSVPLTTVEFGRASGEYAIVFAGDGDSEVPVVILGVVPEQNLYVTPQGKWTADYIPAFVRRYPFVFASDPKDAKRLALCVDESYVGCNREGHGERLFDASGERTRFLGNVMAFMQDYQGHYTRTRAFTARLRQLDLLVPMQAQYTVADGSRRSLTGFRVVDRDRLKALAADRLAQLVQADEMEWIFAHLLSLKNLSRVAQRAGGRQTAHDGGADRAH